MTLTELISLSGIPTDRIAKIDFPVETELPFATWINKTPQTISADGRTVAVIPRIAVEIYCEPEDEETHILFENALMDKGICFSVAAGYLGQDQQMDMWVYEFDHKEEY